MTPNDPPIVFSFKLGLVAVASCGGWFLPFAGKIIPTTVVFTVLHVESYIETRNLMYLFDLSIV